MVVVVMKKMMIIANVTMMTMALTRNDTYVPLEQETGSNFKYTAGGFIPDHPGYIA